MTSIPVAGPWQATTPTAAERPGLLKRFSRSTVQGLAAALAGLGRLLRAGWLLVLGLLLGLALGWLLHSRWLDFTAEPAPEIPAAAAATTASCQAEAWPYAGRSTFGYLSDPVIRGLRPRVAPHPVARAPHEADDLFTKVLRYQVMLPYGREPKAGEQIWVDFDYTVTRGELASFQVHPITTARDRNEGYSGRAVTPLLKGRGHTRRSFTVMDLGGVKALQFVAHSPTGELVYQLTVPVSVSYRTPA